MKKRICIGIFMLILATLCGMSVFAATPYSSKLDSLSSSSDVSGVLAQEQTILNMMSHGDNQHTINPDFSKAQKQYIMNAFSFYNILARNPSSIDAFVKADYAWTIPLEENAENYEYAIVRMLENGEFGSSVITTLDKATSSVEYIFHPEMLDEKLSGYLVDSVATVAIGDISMHVIIASTSEGLLYIPFSDRPELLDITNGRIYSGSDFLNLLEVYIKTRNTSTSSGGESESVLGHLLILFSVSLLCVAFVLLIIHIKNTNSIVQKNVTLGKFKWSFDEKVFKMTKSSKKLTIVSMVLVVAVLIGGFLLRPWGRTKSELTVTKVNLSNDSIYATAPNQLYSTEDHYFIQGVSEYLKGNIQLSQIEEGEKIVVVSNGKVLLSDPYQFDTIYSIRLQ